MPASLAGIALDYTEGVEAAEYIEQRWAGVDPSKCVHPLIVNGRCRECRAFVERYDGVVVTYTASVDQRDLHRGGK